MAIVTVREAQQILKVSREFLYRIPRECPAVLRLGRAVRIDVDRLIDWARTAKGAPETPRPPLVNR